MNIPSTPAELLQGAVERVTFHSEETGFCVLRTKVKGQHELMTVIGSAESITAGEYVQCQGIWFNDRQHDLQFKVHHLKVISSTTLEGIMNIRFDEQLKTYERHELDELNLAYAISIHKSQGSEFPVVVIPLATQHYTLLARNLLYTEITRGKQLVILIGQKKAIGMAVRNNPQAHRLTKLAERLCES